jgi:hypothetical protein
MLRLSDENPPLPHALFVQSLYMLDLVGIKYYGTREGQVKDPPIQETG